MEDFQTSSPVPKKADSVRTYTFYEALKLLAEGHSISRLEWNDENIYGVLLGGHVSIHMNDKLNDWIISDGDLEATDWITV